MEDPSPFDREPRSALVGKELLGSRAEHIELGTIPQGMLVRGRAFFEPARPLAVKRTDAVRRDPGTRHGLAQDPAGASYAVVSDSERFIVLRAAPALQAVHGKTVTVTCDAQGRLLVRPDPGKDIGS